jgi:Uma2 family endonuclease
MGEPALRAMTADEFLAWDDGSDTRHELVDGMIVAMAPPTDAHGTIAVNVAVEIADRLRARPPCRAIGEAGIRLDERNHYKADIAATCAEPRSSLYVEEPFLIVEVISESSERDDFGLKAHRYSLLPPVREIWLVDSRRRWVQVWQRSENAWVVTMPVRGSDSFASAALSSQIELDTLYRNTAL